MSVRGLGPRSEVTLEDLCESQRRAASVIIKEIERLRKGLDPLYYGVLVVGERGIGKSQTVFTALISSGIDVNEASKLMNEGRRKIEELVKYKDLKSLGSQKAAYNALKDASKLSLIQGLVVLDDVERLEQGLELTYGLIYKVIYRKALRGELDIYPIMAIDKRVWEYSIERVGVENVEIIRVLKDRSAVFEIYWKPRELVNAVKKWINWGLTLPPDEVLLKIAELISAPRPIIDMLYKHEISSYEAFVELLQEGAVRLWSEFVKIAYSPRGVLSRGSARAVWPDDIENIVKKRELFEKALRGDLTADDVRPRLEISRKERERPGRSLNTACRYGILDKVKNRYKFTKSFLIASLRAATDPLSAADEAKWLEENIRRTKEARKRKAG